ncbi:MAG: chain length determinant protein EpsF [Betaproteobacteria bacterium]|nr:chain length determinant protein EpsF [Betaproteobacteria bacterium]
MNPQQFLLILRARYKLVLFVLFTTVIATLVVSLLLPKQYTATAAVVVDTKSPDPLVGILPAMAMPGYMATQVDIISSDRVAQKVVKLLRLDANPTVRAQWMEATQGKGRLEVWLADLLQRKLEVKPARESNVIIIGYKGNDPTFVAAVANAFTQAYIETNIELKVEPARQYAKWFGEQGKSLRDNLEKAQAKLSEYQQLHGIVAVDERLDNETAKHNDLSTQLTIVQGQTSKLQELAGNLGRNHPQYKRAESEIATLKQKLEIETRHITSGFSTSRGVGKEKEAELTVAIEAQKKKLLELKSQRDELAVLMRDVDAAQKAYEAVSQRFNQTSLESQSTQTNVAVLTSAAEPTEPSFPKLILNMMLSVFMGTLLGVGTALVLEILDQRVRSTDDLGDMLQLPILGVLIKQSRGGPKRLAFWRRRPALTAR